MLDKERMNLVVSERVIFSCDKELHNTQPIYEHLLLNATKLCDSYCTDILILIEHLPKVIFEENITEIDIFFTRWGINWEYSNGREVGGIPEPKQYRRAMKILLDENGDMSLYEQAGNC